MRRAILGAAILTVAAALSHADPPVPDIGPSDQLYALSRSENSDEIVMSRIYIRFNETTLETAAEPREIWRAPFPHVDKVQKSADGKFALILGRTQEEGKGRLLLVSLAKPETHPIIDVDAGCTAIALLEKDKKTWVGMIVGKDRVALVDPETAAKHAGRLADWQGVSSGKITVRDGRGTFADLGGPEIAFPWIPSKEISGDIREFELLHNDARCVILQGKPVFKGSNVTPIYCLTRKSGSWESINLKGDRSIVDISFPWLGYTVAWDYPEADKYGPYQTGEYFMINPFNKYEGYGYFDPRYDMPHGVLWGDDGNVMYKIGPQLRYTNPGEKEAKQPMVWVLCEDPLVSRILCLVGRQ